MARTRILFLAALLVMLSILSPYHVSAGSGVRITYRWLLTFDFANNEDGLLTTTVRIISPNGSYHDVERKTPVNCIPSGSGTVTVTGGAATFANQGYLQCNLPSIREEIRAIHPPANPDDFQDPFWVRVVAGVNPNVNTGLAGNPTFVHPDIGLYMPYNTTTQQGQARLITGDQDSLSDPFAISPANDILANQRNWYEENGSVLCTTRFLQQGVSVSHTTYICPQGDEAMNFSLDASSFTIGYSPAYSTYFRGKIQHIEVDPVEWGDLD